MQNKILQRKRALRTALLVLLLGVAGMTKSLAQEFVYGDLKYSITYLGPYFWGNYVRIIGHVEGTSASGDLTIPGELLYDNNGYQVVGIGNDAFKDCTGLNSVTIHSNYSGPDIFFDIESHAFEGCTMLSSFSCFSDSIC